MTDDDITRRIDPDDPEATRAFDDDPDATRAFDPLADEDENLATRRMPAAAAPLTADVATQAIGVVPGATADGPRTERIAFAAQRSIAGWLIAVIVVVCLGVGMAVGYSQSEGGDDGVVVRKLVGPKGGVLEFDGTGRVEIPAGALPTATAITVRKVTNDNRVRLGAAGDGAAKVYEPGELDLYAFDPEGLRFQQPVKITIPRPADGTALLVDTPDGLKVVGAEAKGPTVTFETTTLSFEDL